MTTMKQYCDNKNIGSAEEDERQIIEVLKFIVLGQRESDLTLTNFYRNMPVTLKATVNTLRGGVAEFSTHKLQTRIMAQEPYTLVRTAHLPYPVLARVRQLDEDTHKAWLCNFSFVEVHADKRSHVWVEMEDAHPAIFSNRRFTIQGNIRNLSLGGIALLSPELQDLPAGTVGVMELEVEPEAPPARVPAALLRINPVGRMVEYVFTLDRGTRDESRISRFIARRQAEIIRKLANES